MEVLYISFYTPNYKGYVSGLVGSLDKLGLAHDVRQVPCKGGFLANVRYKPQFIREMMEAHPDVDALVWLDIDAIVNRRPALFYKLKDADMAAYFRPIKGNRKQKDELLSGTLFVRNTPKVREAMDKWITALASASQKLLKPEQEVLQRMLGKLGLKMHRLPQNYCWIIKADPPSRRCEGRETEPSGHTEGARRPAEDEPRVLARR
ncbi:hypothetical protein LCGC14_2853390 [marine sediment metagenome]|uniref:Nucleotide-diphospho-sugar transferase domain-containing protein n=1 Tax=marine sediment metagenome TaxID=412755 RepID=A0A0F8Y7Q4_9ZZZZ